jgi:Ring finger domain
MEFEINDKKFTITRDNLLSRDQFNDNVINKIFTTIENMCAICYNHFDENNPPKFLGNQCKCMTVYHENCIQTAIKNFKSCPTCRASKVEIVSTKFSNVNIAKYEELFNKALPTLEHEEKLIFITNWKTSIPSQYMTISTLINPYDYLNSFRYSSDWKSCSIFEKDVKYIEFESPKYTLGESTIKDLARFRQHFEIFTYSIIDNTFNWNGVVIAGGSISKLLMQHMELQDYPIDSDVDLFIYGQTLKDRIASLISTLTYFRNKFGNKVYFASKGYVIDIYITGIERTIQIVMANNCNIDDILYNFDLDYVKVAYQNGQIIATPQFIASFKYQVSQINNSLFRMRRIIKMKGTGISLLTTEPNLVNVIKYVKERQRVFYIPHESDIFEQIVKNIAEASNIISTAITQDPNKCISLLNSDNQPKRMSTKYGGNINDETFVLEPSKFDDFKNITFNTQYKFGQHYHVIKYPGLNNIFLELGSGNLHTKTMQYNGEINVGLHYNDQEIRTSTDNFLQNIIDIYKKIKNPQLIVIRNSSIITVTPKTKIIQNGKRLNAGQIMFKNKAEQMLVSVSHIVYFRKHNMASIVLEAKEIRL